MAESNFQPLTDINVYVGSEITFGTATLAAGTWNEFQVLDYNFSFPSAALEVAPTRAGRVMQADNQIKHRPENELYSASLTMRGTPSAVLSVCSAFFADGSSPATIAGDYAPPHSAWKDGTASTTQQTLLFTGAGSDATNNDILMTSCIPTRMKIMEDVGSNNGMLVVEVDYVSGYKPSETNLVPTSPSVDGGVPKYIQNLTTMTLNTQPLVLWSWDLELSRTIQRVSYIDSTDWKPYGMVQVGDIELTMNMSAKSDDSINDLASNFYSDSAIPISIAESSGFTVSVPLALIDKSALEKGDGIQMANIPLRGVSDSGDDSATVLSITIA